ncbi:MAG: GNAT family N-acetyltransferase [Flavobacteriales bacterium]|nr:MAG: GNAT family N-acetyltransferase [Flavobacteriales bacterium]
MEEEKLDNPTWYALTERHADFAINYDGAKFYDPAYCPFGGFTNLDTVESAIAQYALLTDNFFVVGQKPQYNVKVQLKNELICNQMLLARSIEIEITNQIVALQTAKQKEDLLELVNLVQPGYFKPKTVDLGNYYGIYQNDKLVAVTGERMKLKHFTEVSAVVTHPDHTGKGYAKQLVAQVSNHIFKENKIPFLHVAGTNIGAIKLYEKLGFQTRRKISFWNFIVNGN